MKRVLSSVGRALKSNLHLKIISVVVAVLIWLYVMGDTNPIRTVTVDELAVGTQGTQELHDKNLAVVSDNLSNLIKVRVNVNVGRQDIATVSNSTVSATIDLSSINAPGEYELDIEASTPLGSTVQSITPSTVTVNVENLITRDVPVTVVTQGEPAIGYYIPTPDVTPSLLTIEGTESIIERVVSAVCTIDLSEYVEDTTQSMRVSLFDKDGEQIYTTGVSSEFPSVVVNIDVSELKVLTVDEAAAMLAIKNVAVGYEITGITLLPESVEVVGQNLQNVTTLTIEDVDASGASSDITLNASLTAIEGVDFPGGRNITLNVQISEKVDTVTFDNISIEIQGQRDNFEYNPGQSRATVSVTGTLSALDELRAEDIIVFTDVSSFTSGSHATELKVELPQIEGISSVTIEPSIIALEVTQE